MKRVFLIVLDSFGVGALPDAADFGDTGTNTLRACAGSERFHVPNLLKLGTGCAFCNRCDSASQRCREEQPEMKQEDESHWYRCFLETADE